MPKVIFAVNSYLPRTYTWVHNQLRFLAGPPVLILSSSVDPARKFFPLGRHSLFAFPGFETLPRPNLFTRIWRRIIRLPRRQRHP